MLGPNTFPLKIVSLLVDIHWINNHIRFQNFKLCGFISYFNLITIKKKILTGDKTQFNMPYNYCIFNIENNPFPGLFLFSFHVFPSRYRAHSL